jgi:putative endonuclease
MSFYVYILQSEKDLTYYKGFLEDYAERLLQHNAGLSRYTSNKRPWKLVYVEIHPTKKSAIMREKKLKRVNSDYLRWLIGQPTNLLNG